jgi:nucleotide-binding universal stress UspA family protein
MKKGVVLVATALDEAGDVAIRQAADIARARNAAIHVCHIIPESYGLEPLFPHLREQGRDRIEEMKRAVETAIDDQIRRVLGNGEPCTVSIETGSPHTSILRLAEQVGPELIVMGMVAGKPGTTTERVARHAPCSVLVAASPRGKIVLAGTDFSDPALPAIHAGMEEARRRGLPCHVLHSVELVPVPVHWSIGSGVAMAEDLTEALRADAREKLDHIRERMGPEVKTLLTDGPASDALVTKANELDAELIVVSTHGRSGLNRLALGSVAESVLRRSHRSVLVVRSAA